MKQLKHKCSYCGKRKLTVNMTPTAHGWQCRNRRRCRATKLA